ncbi:MAG: prohibitin family protein [Clostridia bacterium]|nr:prohibitin family protein [Clostridia bacterium]
MAENKVININPNAKKIRTGVIIVVVAIVLIFLAASSISIVPAGNKGVQMNMGAVTGTIYNEGINFKIPFIQSVEIIDTRVQKYESSDNASASKDLQTITSSIAVNFRVDSSKVDKLYQNIGTNYKDTVISPAISECIKAVTSQYTAEQLITKRSEVSEKMKTLLQEKLQDKYILIDSFNITDFQFSEAFNTSIEEKQIAEQNALKAQYDLERIKTEAEQTITEASGEAEAMKIKNNQVTDNIIKLEFIKKWNGEMPKYYGGDGNLFLGLDDGETSKTETSSKPAE